jgi:hypothetical protein
MDSAEPLPSPLVVGPLQSCGLTQPGPRWILVTKKRGLQEDIPDGEHQFGPCCNHQESLNFSAPTSRALHWRLSRRSLSESRILRLTKRLPA